MKPVKVFIHKWIKKPGSINVTSVLTLAVEYQDAAQDDEEICDHAFRIFNAPEEFLFPEEKEILGDYHKNFPSLSVGDFVQVGDVKFECMGSGWQIVNEIPVGKETELK